MKRKARGAVRAWLVKRNKDSAPWFKGDLWTSKRMADFNANNDPSRVVRVEIRVVPTKGSGA